MSLSFPASGLTWLCVVALLAAPGCRSEPSPSAVELDPAVVSVTSTQTRLALEPPRDKGPLEDRIIASQALLAKLPSKVDAWVSLGRLWSQKARESGDPGFHLNARDCADAALSLDPKGPAAVALLGQTNLIQHQFAEAVANADKALASDPDDLVALAVRSDALLELGRFDECAAAVQQMVDLKPSLASYSRVSYLRWLHGDTDGAREAIRMAIASGYSSRDPEPYAWVLVQAAVLFWQLGDVDGAAAGFEMALTARPDYPPALVGNGRVAMAKARYAEAAALFARAYDKSPLVETAWLLGDARTLTGDTAGAAAAYELVGKRGRVDDGRTLALFLATQNRDLDDALQLARRERAARGDLYTDDALGFVLLRRGELAEARVHLDAAVRLGTKDAMLLYHHGLLLLAEGKATAGRAELQSALALNPGFNILAARDATSRLSP